MRRLLPLAAALSVACAQLPPPSSEQLHYLESDLTMFMHFSVCTFNDGCDGGQQNCGYGGKSVPYPASTFNPTSLDTDQWARVAVDLGARQVCLTVHHSGGFALWPSGVSQGRCGGGRASGCYQAGSALSGCLHPATNMLRSRSGNNFLTPPPPAPPTTFSTV